MSSSSYSAMSLARKKKKYNARFPPARIKKIMQSDEEVGKVAAAVPVIISRALELFVETLLKRMDATMTERGARTMTPGHLKLCIHSEPRFDFLKDLVLDVPDLAPDNGEESLTPQPCALSASSTTGRTTNGTPRAPRLPRQISTVKSRTRQTRRGSSEAVATARRASQNKFVDLDETERSSEDEADALISDEENSGHSTVAHRPRSLPGSPQLGPNSDGSIKTPLGGSHSFVRSLSCAPGINGSSGPTNGHTMTPVPFTLSFPPVSLLGEAQAEAQAEDDAGPTNRSSANLIPHIPPSPKRGATSKSVKTSSHGAMDLSSSLGSTSPGSNHLLSSHTQTNPPSSFGMTGPPLNLVLSRGLGCNEDEDDDYDS
ncbi:dr1-associated corepressor-like [Tigriopus californicus]|uniref:dr1-associated corepressor-like n=1 Tax=Tigriopus californicus TaxID=6832 RepID=UPI0027DA0107|nr:dr1-associated corepressor-like [Tigriopus californicus]